MAQEVLKTFKNLIIMEMEMNVFLGQAMNFFSNFYLINHDALNIPQTY